MQKNSRVLNTNKIGFTISNAGLKYLGWMCTLAGVVAASQYSAEEMDGLKGVLLLVSYIALPIFGFLTVEGVTHTSDFGKYVGTTLIAAVAAELFYDYVRTGTWFYFIGENAQNVLFSIVIAQLTVYFLKKTEQGKAWGLFLKILLTACGMFWAMLLQCQYSVDIVLYAALVYLLREHKLLRGVTIALIGSFTYFTPFIAVFFITCYSNERGRYNKYLFYILYPAMWMFLAVGKLIGF